MNNHDIEINILGWWGAFPQPNQATCGVMLRTSDGTLLLDCGSGVLAQYLSFGNSQELQGAILSHLHFDHTGDMGVLSYLINHDLRLGLRSEKLPVFTPLSPQVFYDALISPYFDMQVITEKISFSLGGFDVTVKRGEHSIESYSYRLERDGKAIAYMTDTTYLNEAPDFVRGADLLICEATNSPGGRHSPGAGHMSDVEAGRLAKLGEVKQLCLYHLPSDGDIPLMRERAASAYGKPVFTPDLQRTIIL